MIDLALALEMVRRAASDGNQEAIDKLKEMGEKVPEPGSLEPIPKTWNP